MNFLTKLFRAPTTDSAIASIGHAFSKLDQAVENHTNLCAAANQRERELLAQAHAATDESCAHYAAAARAQRIKLRLSDLIA